MDKSNLLCRLCVEVCNDCKSLYDEDGSSTDVYETTVKYFDPMVGRSMKMNSHRNQ